MADLIADGIWRAPNGLYYFSPQRFRAALTKARGSINVAEQLLLTDAIAADAPEPPQNARDILPEYDEV